MQISIKAPRPNFVAMTGKFPGELKDISLEKLAQTTPDNFFGIVNLIDIW